MAEQICSTFLSLRSYVLLPSFTITTDSDPISLDFIPSPEYTGLMSNIFSLPASTTAVNVLIKIGATGGHTRHLFFAEITLSFNQSIACLGIGHTVAARSGDPPYVTPYSRQRKDGRFDQLIIVAMILTWVALRLCLAPLELGQRDMSSFYHMSFSPSLYFLDREGFCGQRTN